MNLIEKRLDVAKIAAAEAAKLIRQYYQLQKEGRLGVELKADTSPVTQADIESEKVIREILLNEFPNDGFYGEETGQANIDAEFVWLIDPIDGTKSFIREYPFFSTQIACMQNNELLIGVSSAPQFEEIAFAIKDQFAYLNNDAITVSDIANYSQATLSLGNIGTIASRPEWNQLGQLIPRFNRIRGYGDFYHYHLLAAGKIDAVIESDLNILDIAALKVIVEAAGGKVSQLNGEPVNLNTRDLLATNGHLHNQLLEELNYH